MQQYASQIGFVAGILTTGCFLPQIYKILKTKHTKDLSLGYYLILGAGIFLWLSYGVVLGAIPIILANGSALFFVLLILGMKLKYG